MRDLLDILKMIAEMAALLAISLAIFFAAMGFAPPVGM